MRERVAAVLRVSRMGDRETASLPEQEERVRNESARIGAELVAVETERDVSGGAPLERRPGLLSAVGMIERGDADVLMVAYFDRLVRSLVVQHEVVERVERAGGRILAVDFGEIRADTPSRWLSSTMLGMVAEYHRRQTAYAVADAHETAIAEGVAPFPHLMPGVRRGEGGRLEVDPELAPIAREAFRRRSEGQTLAEVRRYLAENGVKRGYQGMSTMMASRLYIGELVWGRHVNRNALDPIVDRVTWQRVQRMRSSRGRGSPSERLLARLDVLRCGTCGRPMVVGTTKTTAGTYWFYRCSLIQDCSRPVSIGAPVAETAVVERVQAILDGMIGTAYVDLSGSERALELTEARLAAAIEAFTGLEDIESARLRLLELRAERDRALADYADQRALAGVGLTITARGDWHRLLHDEQRALIRATLDRAEVRPGRGSDRLLFVEKPVGGSV